MDTYGFIALAIGFVIWIATRKQEKQGGAKFGIFVMGAGVGILIGTVGAYLITMRVIDSFAP